jgi:nicotinate-nucleotide adenylyltransferase
MTAALPRIGVLGGLFNPPHIGHLVLCQEAAWQLGLTRVVLVPTRLPPHREAPAESGDLRLRLAQAAVLGSRRLSVSRVELDRPGPSYPVDTLRELASRFPGAQLVLLLGEDQLAALDSWHEPQLLLELAELAVARRSDVRFAGEERTPIRWVAMPRLDVSSSDVRARVAQGRPIRHLVPDAVRELIVSERLYLARERDDAGRE